MGKRKVLLALFTMMFFLGSASQGMAQGTSVKTGVDVSESGVAVEQSITVPESSIQRSDVEIKQGADPNTRDITVIDPKTGRKIHIEGVDIEDIEDADDLDDDF